MLVGFAAEHGGDFVARARGKLERKGLDAIVVNDVSDASIGFETGENEVTVVSSDDEATLPRGVEANRRRRDSRPHLPDPGGSLAAISGRSAGRGRADSVPFLHFLA